MLVVFIATVVRSTFGFGEALVAVPLLALRIPVDIAAPLAVLLSITVAGVIVVQDWRKIHVGSASWLVLATLAGIPLGLWWLTAVNERHTKIILGAFILLYSIYSLSGRRGIHLKSDSRAWLLGCGFFAGVLGGAYGLNGPPLVIYGSMRRWSVQHFRATLQGYFLPASAITMVAYFLAGLWKWPVTYYYLWSLPPALIAIFIGRALNHRLPEKSFLKYVYLGLAGIGMLLLAQAVL
jgi:hypothetical protein